MKLLDKYFAKIDFTSKNLDGGFFWMNSEIKNKPLKDIKKIDFNSLYANITTGLVNRGIHLSERDSVKISLDGFKDLFESFESDKHTLKVNNPSRYGELKASINSFIGSLFFLSRTEMSLNYSSFITQYLKYFYQDLLENNKNILYIDTDSIFYSGEIDLLDFNVDYTQEKFEYILFVEERRYVTYTKGIYKTFGSWSKKKYESFEVQLRRSSSVEKEAIDLLKRYIRENKIEVLGI